MPANPVNRIAIEVVVDAGPYAISLHVQVLSLGSSCRRHLRCLFAVVAASAVSRHPEEDHFDYRGSCSTLEEVPLLSAETSMQPG